MATGVDPGYAGWLKSPARLAGATVTGAGTKWPDIAVDSSVITALADKSAAEAEADAQAAFFANPFTRDRVVVAGQIANLIGRIVKITGNRLGYEAGADVLVIGVREEDKGGVSTLTVLKRI